MSSWKHSKKINQRKQQRELVSNISMFLLNKKDLRGLIWTVKKVNYIPNENRLEVGVNAQEKLGTVLEKMRKSAKELAHHLCEVGLTQNRVPHIKFFVDKEDEFLERVYQLIEDIHAKVEKIERGQE
jgi:hypothetical protein